MLEGITTEYIFHFILIFARLGAAFSIFPALGDKSIFLRARVIFALVVSFVIYPLITGYLPKYVENVSLNASLLVIEMLIGLIISIGAKFYFLSLHIIGQILSMQSGLGSATFFDPAQRSQVAIFTSFLFIITTTAIFVSDTHYLFIQAVIESYTRFPPGEMLKIADISDFISHIVNDTFVLAFKISSPFLIISIAVLIGSGILSRLMPNLQVFFVITPAQIFVMFCTLYIVINTLIEKVIEAIQITLKLTI
jgi:flagellar biosynthetic protein FliR